MKATKIIKLLSALDHKEIKAFRKYIHSPYFNTHKETIIFFEHIYEAYPDFNETSIDAIKIHAKMFPGEEYDEKRMRIFRKYIVKHLMNFLGQRGFEEDPMANELYKLERLLHHKHLNFFGEQARKVRQQLLDLEIDNSQRYLDSYHFENTMVHFRTIHTSRWEEKDFEKASGALNQYFVVEKLRLYCSQLNESLIFQKTIEREEMIEALLDYCEKYYEENPLIIKIYYCMVKLGLQNDRYEYYDEIKKAIPFIHNSFSRADQINIYNYLINFCYKLYQKGVSRFEGEMFGLYKEMLEYQLLFEEGLLSTNHYKNISTLGLRLGEFDWTQQFIEHYKSAIDSKYRDSVYSYNKALYFFYQRDYSQALKFLQMVIFIEPFYKISHDLLLLKIYFERKNEEAFMSLCLNFQNFIRRKKSLQENQQKAYLNFIQSARALFLVKIAQRNDLGKVRERIDQSETIIEKNWLKEKFFELENEQIMSDSQKLRSQT